MRQAGSSLLPKRSRRRLVSAPLTAPSIADVEDRAVARDAAVRLYQPRGGEQPVRAPPPFDGQRIVPADRPAKPHVDIEPLQPADHRQRLKQDVHNMVSSDDVSAEAQEPTCKATGREKE